MTLATQRLDQFLAKYCQRAKGDIRLMLAQKRVLVDGETALDISQRINKFSKIVVDGKVLQNNAAHYIMLYKPKSVVCATKDKQHQTVIDILPFDFKDQLHIVGRLDLNTSGLVLLTNDSRWSEKITQPDKKVEKTYQVTLQNPIDNSYITSFEKGMYFAYENITTLPAKLTITGSHSAQVKLVEGKYHQIKRMFGRFRNPVVELHRSQVGNIKLDPTLSVGQCRALTQQEVARAC